MKIQDFDFNIDKRGLIHIGIMRLGIVFGKEAIKALGSPKTVSIGIDRENKVLGITKGIDNTKNHEFCKKGNEKWIRVNSKSIINEISKITGIKYTNTAIKIICEKDGDFIIAKLGE